MMFNGCMHPPIKSRRFVGGSFISDVQQQKSRQCLGIVEWHKIGNTVGMRKIAYNSQQLHESLLHTRVSMENDYISRTVNAMDCRVGPAFCLRWHTTPVFSWNQSWQTSLLSSTMYKWSVFGVFSISLSIKFEIFLASCKHWHPIICLYLSWLSLVKPLMWWSDLFFCKEGVL